VAEGDEVELGLKLVVEGVKKKGLELEEVKQRPW
jgi:hypothetical protein